ncbi:glycosyltransferase [Acanthamoeba polyphaga moumouvirus]|uniref:Glycosyltransferase n=1 Tax=Acanthamoeba polyphaga moumouvirus TaxID=1269028 RepID=L7RBS6_9VIRU|nr:glycosyltransferase [Acanthamoeba polyphaga moumouvirus]AGC01984.1 glycosyltransferase [Acanthamoeba polyphaga moumouvirus]
MIPKIIHQIWIQGYNQIPEDLKILHISCQNINNDFEHILWDDDKIKDMLKNNYGKKYLDLYENYTIMAQKADFARYAILYKYGGIYLDMDMVCRKNLAPFLQYNFFFTAYLFHEYFKRYLNGIIGSIPKHPVFAIIFKNIFERKHLVNDVHKSTATELFYDSITEYAKINPNHDMVLIDRKFLHPCNIYNDETCPYTCTDCYVAHTNYSSWSPGLRFFKTIIKYKYILLIILLVIIIVILFLKCEIIKL